MFNQACSAHPSWLVLFMAAVSAACSATAPERPTTAQPAPVNASPGGQPEPAPPALTPSASPTFASPPSAPAPQTSPGPQPNKQDPLIPPLELQVTATLVEPMAGEVLVRLQVRNNIEDTPPALPSPLVLKARLGNGTELAAVGPSETKATPWKRAISVERRFRIGPLKRGSHAVTAELDGLSSAQVVYNGPREASFDVYHTPGTPVRLCAQPRKAPCLIKEASGCAYWSGRCEHLPCSELPTPVACPGGK